MREREREREKQCWLIARKRVKEKNDDVRVEKILNLIFPLRLHVHAATFLLHFWLQRNTHTHTH